jgi:hypothetical protein
LVPLLVPELVLVVVVVEEEEEEEEMNTSSLPLVPYTPMIILL